MSSNSHKGNELPAILNQNLMKLVQKSQEKYLELLKKLPPPSDECKHHRARFLKEGISYFIADTAENMSREANWKVIDKNNRSFIVYGRYIIRFQSADEGHNISPPRTEASKRYHVDGEFPFFKDLTTLLLTPVFKSTFADKPAAYYIRHTGGSFVEPLLVWQAVKIRPDNQAVKLQEDDEAKAELKKPMVELKRKERS